MAKPYRLLREKMSPERRARVDARVQEILESLLESAEVLADPEAMADLRASLEDLRAGRTVFHEEVGRRLGL
jgi:hypothetical protein